MATKEARTDTIARQARTGYRYRFALSCAASSHRFFDWLPTRKCTVSF